MKNREPSKAINYPSIFLKAEWPNLVLYAFLLSPIFISLAINRQNSKIDLLSLYTVALSISWLLVIRFNPFSLFRTHLFLLPFYLAASVDLFLVWNFHERLTAGYMFITMTNYKEASNFLVTYWRSITPILIIFVLFYGTGLAGLYERKSYKNSALFLFFSSVVLLGYGAYFYKAVKIHSFGKAAALDLISKDQSTPTGYLSQVGLTTDLYFESENLIQQRRKAKIEITRMADDSNIDTVVFVIGESSRPQNWSLFGYDKSTTPYLDKESGIYKFDRVCTTAPYTAAAVPSMLSLEPISNWNAIVSNKSLVSILGKAGYDTYWLSTQEVDSFGGIIPHVAAEAQYRQYFSRGYDGTLIPEYEKILLQNDGRKQAIFIHIKGSHFQYSRRYPENFNRFNPSSDSEIGKMVAEYDNTILYTDWLLEKIIDQLKLSKKPSILIYASDHGENLMDDERNLLGHGLGNEYDLSTSAFIWASDNINKRELRKLSKLKQRGNEKISVSSLSHTLLDVIVIATSQYNPEHSLLSDGFIPSKCPYKQGSKYVSSFDFPAHTDIASLK